MAADLQTAPVTVIAVTPTLGTGIDQDLVPAAVQNFTAQDLRPGQPQSIADVLERRMGSVAASDYNGNALQVGLQFRGFNASPVLGDPQGLAVYQNGMRVNEAFGDLVNWDMIPAFAINQMEVLPGANPAFGLNALGGAVSMGMKTGFNTSGTMVDASAGTYGRSKLTAETALQEGEWGFYTGISGMNDYGWRQQAPSRLAQNYTDLAWRNDTSEMGLGLTMAASYLTNYGGIPDELRDASRSAYFTGPDNQRNSVGALEWRGSHQLSDALALQGSVYYRHLRTAVTNGNVSSNVACSSDSSVLCASDGTTQLYDRNGGTISSGNTFVINQTLTVTDGYGASAQTSYDGQVLGHKNTLIFGSSVDAGDTRYVSAQLAGTLDGQRMVQPNGQVIAGDGNYVGLMAHNLYTGVYAEDVLTLAPAVTATLAARYNTAVLNLHDQQGTSLNATHYYDRLNPAAGLAWQVTSSRTVFANYSEANRIPTAAELSCADPNTPCYVPNGFQADPSLAQVVSRSSELGARGRWGQNNHWSTTAFFTRNANDIYFVADSTSGTGYFRNVGNTQRMGLEGNVDGQWENWSWFGSYTLLRATFDSPMTIASSSPNANSNGVIAVAPGKVMPGVPLHSLKLGASYDLGSGITVGGDAVIKSGVFLRGDENNTQPMTNPYAVFNLDAAWQVTSWLQIYGRANNVFNQKYETAGMYGDGTNGSIFSNFSTTDRFLTSGMPANFWLGTRAVF